MPVYVRGFHELQTAFAHADREVRLGSRKVLRDVAEPVRRDAEGLALQTIPRIGLRWSKMRIGITRNLVYVAPRQRGVKTRGYNARRRPNLAGLLMDRAMEPALEQNEPQIAAAFERGLDRICDEFNTGGPL
jgi:hypothetical protein